MFDWWRKRKERKKRQRELLERYPFTTVNPYQAVIWKAAQKLAAHLKRFRIICRPEETVRQYHFNASRIDGMDREALFAHLYILEESMYSKSKMGELEKNSCIDHLRKIESSLDKVKMPAKGVLTKLIDPRSAQNQPIVLPKEIGMNYYPKERCPEQESIRSSKPEALRRGSRTPSSRLAPSEGC